MVKFRRDSDEMMCGKPVPGTHTEAHGPYACLRTESHKGRCIALMRDAAKADGVCRACRVPEGAPHKSDCDVEDVW